MHNKFRTYNISVIIIGLILFTSYNLEAQELSLKFDHITVNNGLPQNTVYSIAKDKFGFMWFVTPSGVVRYDGYTIKVFRTNANDSTALPDSKITTVITDTQQNIWIKTNDTAYLFRYNYDLENFTRFALKKVPADVINLFAKMTITFVHNAQNKKYKWYSTPDGIVQENKSNGKKIIYAPSFSNSFSLNDITINCLYIDDCENLWVGTTYGGVNHAYLNIKPFDYYHTNKTGTGLIDNAVRAISQDNKGRLWIGSDNIGITIVDPISRNNNYTYIGEKKLPNLKIRSIFCDKQGFVWIGTKNGLVYHDTKLNKYTLCSKNKCDVNVFSLLEDHLGTLWVGSFNGLAAYDRIKDRYECLDPDKTTVGRQIMAIIEDKSYNLWIGTEDKGLTKLVPYNTSLKTFEFKPTNYIHNEENKNSLINNSVNSLTEDKNGMIWVATSGGLSRFNPKDNSFKNFTKKNGLSDNLIMGVLFDGRESVWISHKKGLSRLNINTLHIQNFNIYDGLQGFEFNANACFRNNKTGEMFFGGANGLNSFKPDSIKINTIKPRVVITQMSVMNQVLQPGTRVNNKVILKKSILCTDEITLTWWDKTFTLEFAALQLANPLGNKYKYKLIGFEKNWVYSDASNRTVTYHHLPSGNYEFMVYAANSDNVWSDVPAVLHIKILPPWWLTWWAILIYIVICSLIIWFIYKYIISRIEIHKSEEIHQAKLRFFTEVSHEFRTPLTLIIDPLERIINENLSKDIIKQYSLLMYRNARQLLNLVNQLLDFRKLEAGLFALSLKPIDIISFVRTTASAFESQAKKRNITFNVVSSVNKQIVQFDDSKMIIVFNNLLSNAFKFTPDGGIIEVAIDLSTTGQKEVVINIKDNGVGISKNDQTKVFELFFQSHHTSLKQEGSGIGLAFTKELILLHGGNIFLESVIGKGSCFSIFLPVSENEEVEVDEILKDSPNISILPIDENGNQPIGLSKDLSIVLVVDDNEDIRDYIEQNFSKLYQIKLAVSGSDGFQKAIEIIPDIVISDIMMPGMSGLELCRLLKADERTSHIPVILLTARQSDESKAEGFETGADAYVTKPFNTNVLHAQVRNILIQRQRLRELYSNGSNIELKKISINVTDEAFLRKVVMLIESNMTDEEFDIDSLAEKLKMSRSQFYRKIKALTNKSLQDFVSSVRMNKALEYLLSGEYNISEIAYKVGYSLPNNFTRTFVKHFGATPSQYLEQLKN